MKTPFLHLALHYHWGFGGNKAHELTNAQVRSVHSTQTLHASLYWSQFIPAQHLCQASDRCHASFESKDKQCQGYARIISDQRRYSPKA
jgi:hypothetical protein